ncbi:MAG TPA: TonB-dependent receptor [Polyangiaceae bacterium]|nr:TonB-dependent receptor [Polyangiaceae bacterium]
MPPCVPAPSSRRLRSRGIASFTFVAITFCAFTSGAQSDPAPEPSPTPDATTPPAPPATPTPPDAPAEPVPPAATETSATESAETTEPAEPAEVTIAGTRVAQTPGSAHVINNKKLERQEYDDPTAILQTVPGVYSRTEDGVGLRPNIGLRGTNPNRSAKVALMEDGVPFGPAPYSAPAAYYFPLMQRMYQVRVLKGPATIVYGPQTVGGAIDFVTRPIPASPSGNIDLAAGQYGYGKVHAWYGTSNDSDGFLLEAVHLRDSGFKELPDDSDTGFYRNEWMVKASHAFDPSSSVRNELELKATYSEEDSHETYLGLTDEDFRADPLQRYAASQIDRMRWNRTSVVLKHVLEPLRNMTITTTAYRNDFHRIWKRLKGIRGLGGEGGLYDVLLNPDGSPVNRHAVAVLKGEEDSTGSQDVLLYGPNDREFVSQGVQSVVAFAPVTGPISHRIEYGIRLHYDRVERRQSEDSYLMLGGNMVPDGSATVVTEYNEQSTESAALWMIDAISWKTLTLTPGVRFEFWHANGTNKITHGEDGGSAQVALPGIGGYWSIIDELGLLAGVYRGFSPPPPPLPSSNAASATQEAPGIKDPELSINYEAGARFTHERARLELIGFYNDYSNLTDVCTNASGCTDQSLDRQFSAGRAKIYGLEAYAEHEPSLGTVKLPLNAAYTLTFAQFLDRFESSDPMWGSVEPGYELPYVPRHQLSATAGIEVGPASGYGTFTYIAAMREEAGSEAMDDALHTDEQAILDLGGRYRVFGPLELYVNLRNVFDSHDLVARRPFGARPNAPRWLQVGAKVDL